MDGEPRICHLERTEHRTTIRNGEETVGPLTGVGMWQGPSRSAASFFVPNRGSFADHRLTRKSVIASKHHFCGGIWINSASCWWLGAALMNSVPSAAAVLAT
jgi:hypothetical protein